MSEDNPMEQTRLFEPVEQTVEQSVPVADSDTVVSAEQAVPAGDAVAPECLPCIDAVQPKKEELEVPPENLPTAEPVVAEADSENGMFPGFNSDTDKADSANIDVAADADLPPEVEPRNNPVFIDAKPPEVKPSEKTGNDSVKAPLVFTEESPAPTRNGEPVADYRERLRRETDNVRKKSFRPMRMEDINSSDSIGMIMTKARRASGYSLDDVKLLTRISENYILEIEGDDTEKIPAVYCSAYILSLCNTYRFDAQMTDFVMELNRKLQSEREQIPVEIMQEINRNVRVNEEEERRLNHIFTGVLIAIGVLLILGLWAVVVMVLRHNAAAEQRKNSASIEQTVQKKTEETENISGASSFRLNFEESKLKNLMPHPAFEFNTLEMSDKPAVNRGDNVK